MRNKIQNSFHELPAESHDSLRDALLIHISQITPQTNKVIVTHLCLALTDLAMLMASWESPVLDLIEKFSGRPDLLAALLEILKYLPEEVNSRYLRLGANRRDEIVKGLEAHSNTVHEFLCQCVTNALTAQQALISNGTADRSALPYDPEHIQTMAIKCFTSWVSVSAIQVTDISDNVIVSQVFARLSRDPLQESSKMHDIATDCLTILLQWVEMCPGNQLLEMQLFTCVMELEKAFQAASAYENMDATMNYCRIFTHTAEAFLERIISVECEAAPHYALKTFDLILKCIACYDYEVARITFHLWYRVSEELYRGAGRDSPALTAQFKPYIEQLITELTRHSQMDADHEGLLAEHDDLFVSEKTKILTNAANYDRLLYILFYHCILQDFRKKVSELINDVVFIVESIKCFQQMFNTLHDPHVTWEGTEAALFVMANVAKNIKPDENDVVPKVVEAILNLPETTHIAVRYVSVFLLGELCDWIQQHPESLQAVLNFLLHALQQKSGLAGAAANALLSICTSCGEQMTCHISGLMQIVGSLDSFEINNDSAIGLLKGVTIIVTRLPHAQLTAAAKEMIGVQTQPLLHLLAADDEVVAVSPVATKAEVKTRKDPTFWLDRLAAILRHTNPKVRDGEQHPIVPVLEELWPVLSRTFMKFAADLRVMERTCRCVRYAIRCVGRQAAVILEPLVKQIVHIYVHMYQHPCFLYLGSILVDEFAGVSDGGACTQGLIEMLGSFIQPTFRMLEKENGLRDHPDTVDDFFRLCARYLQRAPAEFLQSACVNPILQCAMLAAMLEHRDANCSVMKYLENLLALGRSEEQRPEVRRLVCGVVEANVDALMSNLLSASVFHLQTYMLPDVADVLLGLKLLDTVRFLQSLKVALDALPKKNSNGHVTVTQAQLNNFHDALTL